MSNSEPKLTLRLPEARAIKLEEGLSSSPPTPPAAAASAGAAVLLSAQPSTELLPCGLFEDELDELDELVQSHSPKNAGLAEAAKES
ncbi:UDP-glucose dehydrogenase [Chlorella sorokiniana]|uniref:UDP-glucose dehydrogenase n=1 Tax=Chlorella sorokiniana TaxID=3076 RepID=A0A2P6U0L8_CHLSO|nr:UDP-glucose dehydrogenase [Chlorella sorokiniana]|eukprot:PRW59840.1 UDP-glucose dehydrogenase [Chlorella sorokiniana]